MRTQRELLIDAITFWGVFFASLIILTVLWFGIWTLREIWISRKAAGRRYDHQR